MAKHQSRSAPSTDGFYYLQVVNTTRRGRPMQRPLIKMTDSSGRYICWVNDQQAAMLETEYPDQVQWR